MRQMIGNKQTLKKKTPEIEQKILSPFPWSLLCIQKPTAQARLWAGREAGRFILHRTTRRACRDQVGHLSSLSLLEHDTRRLHILLIREAVNLEYRKNYLELRFQIAGYPSSG